MRHRTGAVALSAALAVAGCGTGAVVEGPTTATTAIRPVERVVWDGIIASEDSPIVRLEQSASGGFAPQTWDIGGNEANFFIRDPSNESRLPFRIQPGAPTDALFVETTGEIGIGTGSPEAALHVVRDDDGRAALIEDRSDAGERRTVLEVANNGPAVIAITNVARAASWELAHTTNGSFKINGPRRGVEAEITPDGDMVLGGMVIENAAGEQIAVVTAEDATLILEALRALELATWHYPADSQTIHLSPTAGAFLEAFGLGEGAGIAGLDATGVLLAALQALANRTDELEQRIGRLEASLSGG